MQGTVVRMIRDRGFGFVRCEDGTEVFFHHSALPRGVFDTIQEGQEMEFDIENDVRGRGQRATNVELINNNAYNNSAR
jgi:CspA family cold shock protein